MTIPIRGTGGFPGRFLSRAGNRSSSGADEPRVHRDQPEGRPRDGSDSESGRVAGQHGRGKIAESISGANRAAIPLAIEFDMLRARRDGDADQFARRSAARRGDAEIVAATGAGSVGRSAGLPAAARRGSGMRWSNGQGGRPVVDTPGVTFEAGTKFTVRASARSGRRWPPGWAPKTVAPPPAAAPAVKARPPRDSRS